MNDPYDLVGPPAGPCALCGGADKRHRVFDAVADYLKAGGDPDQIADEYDLPAPNVRKIANALGLA